MHVLFMTIKKTSCTHWLAAAILLLVAACRNQAAEGEPIPEQVQTDTAYSEIKFINKKIDFGTVTGDTLLTAKYDFINTSNNPLIIYTVWPDCTCTGHYLSNDTISPGDSAYILLKMKTEGKEGATRIKATVKTNTKSQFYQLVLSAFVGKDPLAKSK